MEELEEGKIPQRKAMEKMEQKDAKQNVLANTKFAAATQKMPTFLSQFLHRCI